MALSKGTRLGPYVLADGQRFLVATPIGDDSAPPITLIQNWTALLRKGK